MDRFSCGARIQIYVYVPYSIRLFDVDFFGQLLTERTTIDRRLATSVC